MTSKRRDDKKTKAFRPATTPEGRESQLVSLAMDVAEQQLRDGTASAQVISYFIKQGSERDRLERERLTRENELLTAKVKQLASAERMEEIYTAALNAMRSYAGQETNDFDDDEELY